MIHRFKVNSSTPFKEVENNANHAIGLVNLEAYSSIPNVDFANNRFYFDIDKMIEIPDNFYKVERVNTYINNYLLQH